MLTDKPAIKQNELISIICNADNRFHVPTLAKPIDILLFNDLFNFIY